MQLILCVFFTVLICVVVAVFFMLVHLCISFATGVVLYKYNWSCYYVTGRIYCYKYTDNNYLISCIIYLHGMWLAVGRKSSRNWTDTAVIIKLCVLFSWIIIAKRWATNGVSLVQHIHIHTHVKLMQQIMPAAFSDMIMKRKTMTFIAVNWVWNRY